MSESEERSAYKAGTRKSQLALIQTNSVLEHLKKSEPDCQVEVISMCTIGDNVLDKPLPKVGKNVFTKELEEPLANQLLDFVVHSLKDVATSLPPGLTIGAVSQREDPRDVVITKKELTGKKLSELSQGSVVGTSSLRRAAQLKRNFPHLLVKDIRGNLNTRLSKLDADGSVYDAIVLAHAGVKRMGWDSRISEILSPTDMMYAVGQGALAVECRSTDTEMLSVLDTLNHKETVLRVIAERSFMQTLGGGCTAPLAVDSSITDDYELSLTGGVWQLDGSEALIHTLKVKLPSDVDEPPEKAPRVERKIYTGITAHNIDQNQLDAAFQLGVSLAKYLSSKGATEIIANAKKEVEKPYLEKPEPTSSKLS